MTRADQIWNFIRARGSGVPSAKLPHRNITATEHIWASIRPAKLNRLCGFRGMVDLPTKNRLPTGNRYPCHLTRVQGAQTLNGTGFMLFRRFLQTMAGDVLNFDRAQDRGQDSASASHPATLQGDNK